jgi:hypothetical protein
MITYLKFNFLLLLAKPIINSLLIFKISINFLLIQSNELLMFGN